MSFDRSRIVIRSCAAAMALAAWLHGSSLWAQADVAGPLSADEQQALDLITERCVTGTVAFLASDEMAGRGTPSPEYDIAAAYVAARFEAAGLKPGGENGGYYQIAEVDATQVPDSGIVLSINGRPVEHYGLFSAGSDAIEFSGDLVTADPDADTALSGAVVLPFDERYNEPRGIMAFNRAISGVRRRGATAAIVPVAPDNPLIATAQAARARPQLGGRASLTFPVLLCRAEDPLSGACELKIPAAATTQVKMRNVVGVLPGSDADLTQEAVVFSAHLDHLGVRPGPGDTVYNGADDDASGVTAVLSLADAFGSLAETPQRTTIFMAFWGEERGMLGSRYYAEHPLWPLDKIVANVNIEMIGRPEDGARNKVWMTGWDRSNLGEQMALGADRVGTLVFAHPKYSGDMLYGASDNRSFAERGVVAHSFSAGSLHDDYHQPSDEWQKLERDHMTAVIRGLFAGALPIARGQLTPAPAPADKASSR